MKKTSLVALAVVGGMLLWGCQHSPELPAAAQNSAPKKVTVAIAGGSSRHWGQEHMGTVVARHHAEIETKVQARVERIPVALGTHVRQGELLAELDTREFRAGAQQAHAVLEQAAQDLMRFETLLSQNAATQQEYDAVKARKSVAEAGVQEAEALLSYAQITAPFSGVVTAKSVNVGDLAIPGRPLFVVEDGTSLQFVAALPEASRDRINLGDTLQIATSSPDTAVFGIVDEISPSADPLSRTFVTKIMLPDRVNLRAGQFGRLLLPDDEEASISIPLSALVRRGQLELVYVVGADQRAMIRLIRTGRQVQDELEVLSGLSAGEHVVANPPAGLSDGDRIEEQS